MANNKTVLANKSTNLIVETVRDNPTWDQARVALGKISAISLSSICPRLPIHRVPWLTVANPVHTPRKLSCHSPSADDCL